MAVRLATYNVENLFLRAKALNTSTWQDGQPALEAWARFNALAANSVYSQQDKAQMLDDLQTLKIIRKTVNGRVLNWEPFDAWALLRENKGDFIKQPKKGDAVIVATGRDDWIGWAELITENVDEVAARMTAKVISELAADVLCVIEAESRPALVRFNDELLGGHYGHAMLVDGNDPRGIDVGLYSTLAIDIRAVSSNVDVIDEEDPKRGLLFSRDCPVYRLSLPDGDELVLLVNHLKSQSRSTKDDPDIRRTRQSNRVRAIYDELRDQGAEYVAVLGDLNKGPKPDGQQPTLEALVGPGSPLVDATTIGGFDLGPRPGTFEACSLANRLDYILMSPELAARATGGGIFRKGLWGNPKNKKPPRDWKVYDEITNAEQSASDHAAVWVDLDL
ncbi:endonuclease/exonuclease/phosphatase family protein [Lentzea alba]|uniref:endonuclease/exonuclease/phosphatase family protein n=1 Tax=Lentzea alba TaxID=2714351 RepID=UPI0039BF6BA6